MAALISARHYVSASDAVKATQRVDYWNSSEHDLPSRAKDRRRNLISTVA
jgi:hypothetical protein